MAFDAKAFLADVLSKVDEGKRQLVEEALGLDGVTDVIGAGFERQADYSRSMDDLKQARTAAEAEINQAKGVVEAERSRLTEWYEGANKDYEQTKTRLKRYRTEYGDLEGDGDPQNQNQPAEVFTREEHDRLMTIRDQQAIQFADVLTDLKLEHRDRFSEKLDTKALFEHQHQTGLPLEVAYKDFISDRVTQANDEKQAEAVKQAKEEGVLEGRSQAQLPVQPDRTNPVMQALEKSSTTEDRVDAAADAWRAAKIQPD